MVFRAAVSGCCETNNVEGKFKGDLLIRVDLETVLQDMFDKIIEIGRCYGMEFCKRVPKIYSKNT